MMTTTTETVNRLRRLALDGDLAATQEIIIRLEAAEKERDELRTELNEIRYGVAVAHDTIKTLRAKIEHMEKQEPVAEWVDGAFDQYPHLRWRESYKAIVGAKLYTKFYALPGAQPAPSVPTALLVAAANLVAQMEIVRRVGFVDTPNDQDSCAAFCVAEGTWLELMSCVEALTASLAAAPEVKP